LLNEPTRQIPWGRKEGKGRVAKGTNGSKRKEKKERKWGCFLQSVVFVCLKALSVTMVGVQSTDYEV
jgi:hypothetical protein